MRKHVTLLFVTMGLLVASVVPAIAQRTTASLRGTVTDSTHAIIPGATVTVTNQATGLSRTVTTNTEGHGTPLRSYRSDSIPSLSNSRASRLPSVPTLP